MDERLPVAVRAWTEVLDRKKAKPSRRPSRDVGASDPRVILVLDTETTADAALALTFGSWRVYAKAEFSDELESSLDWRGYLFAGEGLLYGDDLPQRNPGGLAILRSYCRAHPGLQLQSRSEWIDEVFHRIAFDAQALVVGFNLPFDLSRLATRVTSSRRHPKGFSFVLHERPGGAGPNGYRPRLDIQALDSKRAFISFGSTRDTDAVDLALDEKNGDPQKRHIYRGRFLDLRTLTFSLTNDSHSLRSACVAFGVEHAKSSVEEHGVITPEYIDYNRRDVLATWELYCKTREEYDRHPIALPPTAAWSPAAIGKAYLEAAGIHPILTKQPDFPRDVLGHAMVAYYGGRAECRVRRTPVPVVYVDYLSMYPTVNTLMGNWRLFTAAKLSVEDATETVRDLLDRVTLDDVFDPALWPQLACLVEVVPNGDVLPARAHYSQGPEWQIGVNPVFADGQATWYTLADLIAAKILGGTVPTILSAVRIVPSQRLQAGLRPVALRGETVVDPRIDDLFRAVIETRRGTAIDHIPQPERDRLKDFLKVLANSASYGIFAETSSDRTAKDVLVERRGLDAMELATTTPEEAGRWCFPPLAAFIAGGARLMLAALERCVADLGGTYAFCDTDSLAVVATETGGDVVSLESSARALSWAEVDGLVARFEGLKPYSADVTATLLKVEDENFDGGKRTQLYCYAISAKRYCLFNRMNARTILRKASESGLGHLMDPLDAFAEPDLGADEEPETARASGRAWINEFWVRVVERADGASTREPSWIGRPALSQFSVSSPALHALFAKTNADKSYRDQVKPFSFMLVAHDASIGADRHIMVAPFESDPTRWLRMPWRDRRTGRELPISVRDSAGGREQVRVTSYADQFRTYVAHIEAKSFAPNGGLVRPGTQGLLLRRPVRIAGFTHVGKEANRIDEVTAGLVPPNEGYAIFEDTWELARRVLAGVPVEIAMELADRGRSATMDLRAGRARSSRAQRGRIVGNVADWCRDTLRVAASDSEALAAWLGAHV